MPLKKLKEYSIWLEPEGLDQKRISPLFRNIQKKTKSVRFKPHVTLLGGLHEKEIVLIKKLKKIKNTKPFIISFNKLSLGKQEFKTVFLECKKNNDLSNLNKLAKKIFGVDKPFLPHMSLVYGDFDSQTKNLIVREIDKINIDQFSFEVKNISLWKAYGTADKWKRVKKVRLLK